MIDRELQTVVLSDMKHPSNKVVHIYGARQTGKSTLAKEIVKALGHKTLYVNGDSLQYVDIFAERNLDELKQLTEGYEMLFIDEAQRIPEIGINLKMLNDAKTDLRILITGSSSLDLASHTKEPLTGRMWVHQMYPVAAAEWKKFKGWNSFDINEQLEEMQIFGMYPELLLYQSRGEKKRYLEELTSSYLYKDILTISNLKYPEKIVRLLTLLAFQIGHEVSIQELAQNLQINRGTVQNYIDLLEKSMIIFRLSGFSRNLRKEVSKKDKIFFYDLGIRNSVIKNFAPLSHRNDTGQLWENFIVAERIKRLHYNQQPTNFYYWRTYTGAELDFIEERDGMLNGFEIKAKVKKVKAPATWMTTYDNSNYQVINPETWQDYIL